MHKKLFFSFLEQKTRLTKAELINSIKIEKLSHFSSTAFFFFPETIKLEGILRNFILNIKSNLTNPRSVTKVKEYRLIIHETSLLNFFNNKYYQGQLESLTSTLINFCSDFSFYVHFFSLPLWFCLKAKIYSTCSLMDIYCKTGFIFQSYIVRLSCSFIYSFFFIIFFFEYYYHLIIIEYIFEELHL